MLSRRIIAGILAAMALVVVASGAAIWALAANWAAIAVWFEQRPLAMFGLYLGFKLSAAGILAGVISLLAMVMIWGERKISGFMQGRVGPLHVGPHGILQSVADGIKLILKEDLCPASADRFLFQVAPYLAFVPVFAALVVLPFGPQWCFEAGLSIGVLYLLAVLAVEVMSTILAGWSSNSKWAVYGAMREACQMVSYEVPLGLSIIAALLVAGTLNLNALGYLQGEGMWAWIVFHNPFVFLAFVLYFIASLASNKRAPFDLPESESELVAGFHTEYSGIRWSFFFFAEYTGMFLVGAIQAYLFLGGWNSPLGAYDPVYMLLGYDPTAAAVAYYDGQLTGWFAASQTLGISTPALIVLNLYCAAWVLFKALGTVFIHMWIRWTLPRIRIDQVLHTCVKVLLPLSLITLVGTAFWVAMEETLRSSMVNEPIEPAALAHVLGPTPLVQWLTQLILTAVGVAMILAILGVFVWARLNASTAPPRTMFADEMPVGQVPFTPGLPGTSR